MLSFQAVRNKGITLADLVADLTIDDLRNLSNEMTSTMLRLIADCVHADVVFEPVDPEADDPFAGTPEEVHIVLDPGAHDRAHHGVGRGIGDGGS